jgi:CDI immunity protein
VKRATVYVRADDMLIHPDDQTVDGLWIVGSPVQVVPSESTHEAIGSAIRESIFKSCGNVSRPASSDGVATPLLTAAGVRSWTALARVASMCALQLTDGELVFTPTRNGGLTGPDRGYHELTGGRLVIPISSADAELGEALTTCVARCQ